MNTLPAVYRLAERTEQTGVYRDYCDDNGQTYTVKATSPDGVRPEQETETEAARVFARSNLRQAS